MDIGCFYNVQRFCYLLFCSVSGGGPFTYSSQQETVVHDLPTDDKDYISVAEEVSQFRLNQSVS